MNNIKTDLLKNINDRIDKFAQSKAGQDASYQSYLIMNEKTFNELKDAIKESDSGYILETNKCLKYRNQKIVFYEFMDDFIIDIAVLVKEN